MGATNPKFAKSVRKPKKAKKKKKKHTNIPKEQLEEKFSQKSNYRRELGAYSFEKKKFKEESQT